MVNEGRIEKASVVIEDGIIADIIADGIDVEGYMMRQWMQQTVGCCLE